MCQSTRPGKKYFIAAIRVHIGQTGMYCRNYMIQYQGMEPRQQKRIIVNIRAEIVCGDKRYASTIENLSTEGAYVVTGPVKSSRDFAPDSMFQLIFRFPSGEKLNLNCVVKWSYQTPPHGLTNSIGLEIVDPPLTFKELLKSLA